MRKDSPKSRSSLDALLPGYTTSEGLAFTSSSSRLSTSIPVVNEFCPAPDGSLTTEEEIEYLTRVVFLITLMAPQPPWLAEHISFDFRADLDNFPASQTCDELAETFRYVHRETPGYVSEVVNLLVDLSERNTSADAVLLIQTVGRPETVRRHSIARLKWSRRDGRWKLYHIWGVRAPFATFDNVWVGE